MGGDDPIFPATKIVVGASRNFLVSGLDRNHWISAGPIRKSFKDASTNAGLPYFKSAHFAKHSPSSVRSSAAPPSNSKPGARTSATKRCLRLSQVMVGSLPSRSIINGAALPRARIGVGRPCCRRRLRTHAITLRRSTPLQIPGAPRARGTWKPPARARPAGRGMRPRLSDGQWK